MKSIKYADFTLEEYRSRVERARTLMEQDGIDALIVTDPANLRYLFGFQNLMQVSVNRSFVGLFIRDDPEESTLFIPPDCQGAPQSWTTRVTFWGKRRQPPFDDRMVNMDKVVQRLKELDMGKERVGLEIGMGTRLGVPVQQFDQLRQALNKTTIVDGTDLLWRLRKIKSEAEIEVLRQVAGISLNAINDGIASLREGITEKQLYRFIYSRMFAGGIDGQGLLCVQFGVDGWHRANMAPTDTRKLQKGDWVYLDGGGSLNGYCADLCRMVPFGRSDKERTRIYESVVEVTHKMVQQIQPNMLCCEVYEVGRHLLEKQGLGSMVKSLSFGHGIGLNVHEMPDLNYNNREPLLPGTVLAVEPWVLDRRQWGLFNQEEMVVVRKEGAEVISSGNAGFAVCAVKILEEE